jgi:hypothetical protein
MTRCAMLIAVAAAFLLAASGCGADATSRSAHRMLVDLHNISQLRTAFNTASGEPRLVVLVSPT